MKLLAEFQHDLDLAAARHVVHRIAAVCLGRIVDVAQSAACLLHHDEGVPVTRSDHPDAGG